MLYVVRVCASEYHLQFTDLNVPSRLTKFTQFSLCESDVVPRFIHAAFFIHNVCFKLQCFMKQYFTETDMRPKTRNKKVLTGTLVGEKCHCAVFLGL